MRLVDTSAWIEWLTGSSLGLALAAELPEREQWLVPTMVRLELAKWLAREADEDRADRVIAFTTCVVASLDTATAASAASAIDVNSHAAGVSAATIRRRVYCDPI
jgi:uncharacterized protein with PIN domain